MRRQDLEKCFRCASPCQPPPRIGLKSINTSRTDIRGAGQHPPAISLLLKSGTFPFAFQKLAGHSDFRLTTQTYAYVQAEALMRAAGVLDRVGLEGEGGRAPLTIRQRLLERVVGKPMGVRSPSSASDCYDNAMCESFFATLECELLDRQRIRMQAEARMAVFEFLEGWYNPHRRHSRAGNLSTYGTGGTPDGFV